MHLGFDETVRKVLTKELPTHSRRGKGGTYTYHKGSDVIRCLNEAFNHGWSSEKLEVTEVEGQVLMLVAITAMNKHGEAVIHHGYGSAAVARTSDNKIVDIGNTYKSAFTNALKKAAEQFGIGLGAEDVEEEPRSSSPSKQAARPANRPTSQRRPL